MVHWERELLVDARSKDVLRVVSYKTGSPPVLEKRHLFLDGKTKQWRLGKVRGLTGLDFAMAVERMEEFEDVLLGPWRSKKRAGVDETPGA